MSSLRLSNLSAMQAGDVTWFGFFSSFRPARPRAGPGCVAPAPRDMLRIFMEARQRVPPTNDPSSELVNRSPA